MIQIAIFGLECVGLLDIMYLCLQLLFSNLKQLYNTVDGSASRLLCSGVLKALISRYLNYGSQVYACLIDASKAF